MIMTRKKKINASFNKLDFNTDDFDTDFLSNYFYSNKKLLVTFASLSLLLLLFIFISLTFNSINYTKNEPLSTNHIKSSGTDTDFLPSRTRNLTLVSALSSEDILEKNLIFIGDVHGSLDELKLLIKKLNYDPESDYLVFLGDLIVRGPKPIEVLKYIKELGATSVRGNHEDKVLRWKQFLNDLKKAYGDDEKKKKDKMNDDDEDDEDDEGDDEDDKVVNLRLKRYFKENNLPLDKAIFKSEHKLLATKLDKELHDYLLSFPIVYEAPSINLYAVHGGLLPEKPLTDQEPFDIMNMRNIESGGIPTKSKNVGVSWSRIWNDSQEKSIHPKYIIYGHDASRGLNIKKYSFGLDSRCSHGGMLTALKWYKNGEKKFYSVECDR